MTRNSRAVTLMFAAMIVTNVASAGVYNLTTDWSDSNNPMGQWALYKNPITLFTETQADYFSNGANYRAWADDPYPYQYHVPFWSRMDAPHASEQIPAGTIFMHGSDPNRTGTDYTAAFLTIPETGVATVSGDAWMPYKSLYRGTHWLILHNGVLMTQGRLAYNDAFDAANPMSFAAGTGGPVALTVPVAAGDRIELRILPNYQTPDTLPWMTGLHIHVNVVPVSTTISGSLTLSNTIGNSGIETIGWTLSNSTNTYAGSLVVTDFGSSAYTLTVPAAAPAGAYTLKFKGGTFLAKTLNVVLTGASLISQNAILKNGDIDQDGEVGPSDFELVVAQFGGVGSADVDNDGEVGPSDFEIIVANFGIGDE